MGENEPMENSEKGKFASPVSADIPFMSTQEMAAIFGGSVIGNFSV